MLQVGVLSAVHNKRLLFGREKSWVSRYQISLWILMSRAEIAVQS